MRFQSFGTRRFWNCTLDPLDLLALISRLIRRIIIWLRTGVCPWFQVWRRLMFLKFSFSKSRYLSFIVCSSNNVWHWTESRGQKGGSWYIIQHIRRSLCLPPMSLGKILCFVGFVLLVVTCWFDLFMAFRCRPPFVLGSLPLMVGHQISTD